MRSIPKQSTKAEAMKLLESISGAKPNPSNAFLFNMFTDGELKQMNTMLGTFDDKGHTAPVSLRSVPSSSSSSLSLSPSSPKEKKQRKAIGLMVDMYGNQSKVRRRDLDLAKYDTVICSSGQYFLLSHPPPHTHTCTCSVDGKWAALCQKKKKEDPDEFNWYAIGMLPRLEFKSSKDWNNVVGPVIFMVNPPKEGIVLDSLHRKTLRAALKAVKRELRDHFEQEEEEEEEEE